MRAPADVELPSLALEVRRLRVEIVAIAVAVVIADAAGLVRALAPATEEHRGRVVVAWLVLIAVAVGGLLLGRAAVRRLGVLQARIAALARR